MLPRSVSCRGWGEQLEASCCWDPHWSIHTQRTTSQNALPWPPPSPSELLFPFPIFPCGGRNSFFVYLGCVKSWKKESKQHLACSTIQGKIRSPCLEADKQHWEVSFCSGRPHGEWEDCGAVGDRLCNPLQSCDLRHPFNFLGTQPPLLPSLWPTAWNSSWSFCLRAFQVLGLQALPGLDDKSYII